MELTMVFPCRGVDPFVFHNDGGTKGEIVPCRRCRRRSPDESGSGRGDSRIRRIHSLCFRVTRS